MVVFGGVLDRVWLKFLAVLLVDFVDCFNHCLMVVSAAISSQRKGKRRKSGLGVLVVEKAVGKVLFCLLCIWVCFPSELVGCSVGSNGGKGRRAQMGFWVDHWGLIW
ncbi:hypothetical protein R3W88_020605 [Solanum pinnatisectum]|uniref:Transmembrane protein n=1 Tax=Solanum pinnatisectum TaxID=50273 RepID=A0AAV9KN57_9SOLN|nr:hypothetical protein R3W88_020605 [Solanum pinnatisectum]